ncbi:MAG: hypothetical protein Kow0092_39430 [Deferrisomatales bacterium]
MGLPAVEGTRPEGRSHLWVGFRRNGRLLGRAVAAAGRVRWGPALGLEFSYPVEGVERSEELFASGRRGARLLVHDGMAGEVTVAGRALAVDDLALWGLLRSRRGRRELWLTPHMEGRLLYRGLEISFAYGPPPPREPPAPAGRTPSRYRRGVLAREEWPFAALAWILYGGLAWLSLTLGSLPLPEAPRPEQVARRFAKLIYEAPQAQTRARRELLQAAERAEEKAEPPAKDEPAAPPPEAQAAPPAPTPSEPSAPEVPAAAEPAGPPEVAP